MRSKLNERWAETFPSAPPLALLIGGITPAGQLSGIEVKIGAARETLALKSQAGLLHAATILQTSKVRPIRKSVVPKSAFTLLFAVMGCGAYDVGGYGGASQGYYDRGWTEYSPGYTPQGYYQRERYDRGWQNQGAQEQRPVPRQPPVNQSPPSAAQNKKALDDLGFRPNR